MSTKPQLVSTRCPHCPRTCPPVPGYGPAPCPIAIIGEGPGYHEARRGIPFVGDTGLELDGLYLPLANLDRGQVYTTNVSRCRMKDGGNPDVPLAVDCARVHLLPEIRQVQPTVIVLLGAVACQSILGPDFSLELEHGIPRYVNLPPTSPIGPWAGIVFPGYHPAAGLHETGMMIQIREDFQALARVVDWLRTGRPFSTPTDLYATAEDYRIISSQTDLDNVLQAAWDAGEIVVGDDGRRRLEMAVDTENISDGSPLCPSFSAIPGTGYTLLNSDRGLIESLTRYSQDFHWVFHYALHDIGYLQRMGVLTTEPGAIDSLPYTDTMMLAYHRGNLPQGLKALSYRLLGMSMTDFTDTVLPYAEAAMKEWLYRIADPIGVGLEGDHYTKPQRKPNKRNPSPPISWKNPWGQVLAPKQQSIDRKATRILADRYGHWAKKSAKAVAQWVPGKGTVDMFKRWTMIPAADREFITGLLGESAPGKGIEHLPVDQLARYAGRDADATLRLYRWFRETPVNI